MEHNTWPDPFQDHEKLDIISAEFVPGDSQVPVPRIENGVAQLQ
jgi:hypothetical protein